MPMIRNTHRGGIHKKITNLGYEKMRATNNFVNNSQYHMIQVLYRESNIDKKNMGNTKAGSGFMLA